MRTQANIRRFSDGANLIALAAARVASLLKPRKRTPPAQDQTCACPDLTALERRQARESINILTASLRR